MMILKDLRKAMEALGNTIAFLRQTRDGRSIREAEKLGVRLRALQRLYQEYGG